MANKKIEKGKVIAEIGNYRVRQVPKYEGLGKKRRVVSQKIAVYLAKKEIQGGFKTIPEALEYATVLAQIHEEK